MIISFLKKCENKFGNLVIGHSLSKNPLNWVKSLIRFMAKLYTHVIYL
jgi:hypothetical protein